MYKLSIIVAALDTVDRIQEHIDLCLVAFNSSQSTILAREAEIVLVTAKPCSDFIFTANADVKLTHICELTGGIYAAMNTGAHISSGDFLVFSNVGDTLLQIPQLDSQFDIICASVQNYYQKTDLALRKPSDNRYLFPAHQGQFIKSQLFKKHYFNERYSSAADLDLFLQIKRKKAIIQYVDDIVASRFEHGGISNSKSLKRLCLRKFERIRIVVSNRQFIGYVLTTFNKIKWRFTNV
jgi:hypothetical protein